jgi:carbon-monoxide dehydrogenase large subunit
MNESTHRFGEAQAPGRVEDLHLLTGRGRFSVDAARPGQAYGIFLRSPHAHAEIAAIDITPAQASPGVLGVFTERDMRALGLIPCAPPPVGRGGSEAVKPPRPVLAQGRVRHVGEPVALVVAESEALALDASERIAVEYQDLPAVTDVEAAVADEAPKLWPEAPGNVALDYEAGDAAAVAAAFARAKHVVRLRVRNNRLAVCTMEPRAALAEFDAATGRYTLTTGSQGVGGMRDTLAKAILRIEPDKLRVVSDDVGGGFGMKTQPYPEYPALLHAARLLGRPVKWTATRAESFLSDNQARDGVIEAALALDGDYRFLALDVTVLAAMGAYLSAAGLGIATRNMAWCMAGVYGTPAIRLGVKCVFTNTAPIGPYRGAGRPEASYIIERIVDEAAATLGIDRIELRRRNLIRPAALPYRTPVAQTYDSGDFERILDAALDLADWKGFPQRRAEAARAGLLRGIGVACFIEHAGARLAESARLRFGADGIVTVYSAAQSQGQGHFTSFAQVVAERLGIPHAQVRVVEGDSDQVPPGGQTTGSRSMAVCGGAMTAACDRAIETGQAIAAHLLEASVRDVVYEGGRFRIAGTDRVLTLQAVAAAAGGRDWPEDLPRSLDTDLDYEAEEPTFPNGCHVCEVEIDPETGIVRLLRYAGVDDVGRVINPMIVDGQMHGGVAQGAGQALGEHCRYDAGGQLLSGSFMDYALPRAADLPAFDFAYHPVPCRTNVLGVKGAGESGTIGAIPTVANAVMDALRQAGVPAFDMPATPLRVWTLLRKRRTPD